MKRSRGLAFTAALMAFSVQLCIGQGTSAGGQAAPSAGVAGRIPVWKTSTTLGNSQIAQSGGNVGVGTATPAAKLEVNGDAQVDGNFSLSGSILLNGIGPLVQAPNDGTNNFSAGVSALGGAATGNMNTAVGNYALALDSTGFNNTAVGESALFPNSTGSNNVAVGSGALLNNMTGDSNTAVGATALVGGQNTIGSFNTALGYGAGGALVNGSNNLYIANGGKNTESGVTRIGTAGSQTRTYIAGIYGVHTSMSNAVTVLIDSNGNLGTLPSSRRYKEDIHDMADASDGLMQLRPVTFRYKKAYEDGSKPVQYGLIAEEVAEVYPDMVARSADGQVETVRYQLLDPMLLNELQKQHATIRAQQEQIRSLEERLARIEAALGKGEATTASR